MPATYIQSSIFVIACFSRISWHRVVSADQETLRAPHDDNRQSKDFKEAKAFLRKYMPTKDKSLSNKFLEKNIVLALKARHANAWSSDVPTDIFHNYVLPYANLDERRDEWRELFYATLSSVVSNCSSITQAALLINQQIWRIWDIKFKPNQTPAVESPFQVLAAGYASCTGLSIFLVDALRTVGVPARVAGTPRWNTPEGGNHDWVEIWDSGYWSFTGAAEWTHAGLNTTWFFPKPAQLQVPGSRERGIWATSWQPTPEGTSFPMAWLPDNGTSWNIPAWDVTEYYTQAKEGGDVLAAQ